MTIVRASSIPTPPGAPNGVANAGRIAMVVTLVLSPELLGGALPWAVAVIVAMSAASGLLIARGVPLENRSRQAARLLDFAVLATLGWTALQLVPLPARWVSSLVPETVEAWHALDGLQGGAPRDWMPLSLDPGATRLELAKGLGLGAIYFAARTLASSGRRRWVLVGVGFSGAAMAAVAFGHRLADADSVFGLYTPVYASTRSLAPLMNENHLGGFMALVTPVVFGLALDSPRRDRQIAWGLTAAGCAMAGVLSFSRGGILTLALGVGLFLAVHGFRRWKKGRSLLRSQRAPAIVVGLLTTMVILAVVAGADLQREFSYTDNRTVKLDAAVAALPLIASHWLTGVGRGAFSAGFVGDYGSAKRFFYPENILVQWTSEWGVIVGLALLVLVVGSIVRGFRLERSHAHLGALSGLIAIGTHQLVDFSLELAGVAVVAAATLGAVANSREVRPFISLRTLLLVTSIGAALAVPLAANQHGKDTFSLEREIKAALDDGRTEDAERSVRLGLSEHPAEPIFVLMSADLAARRDDPEVGRWINHAQRIAPNWSAPHLLAARWLFSLGQTDQALVELRTGESRDPGSMVQSMCTIMEQTPDIHIVERVTPEGAAGGLFLDRVSGCVPWTSPLAAEIDALATKRDNTLVGPTVRQAKRLILEGEDARAVALLDGLPSLNAAAQLVLAQSHLRMGDPAKAEAWIAPLVQRRRAAPEALRTAIAIQVALRDDDAVRSLASRMRAKAQGRQEPLAEIDLYLGRLYEQAGRFPIALASYRRANRIQESRKTLESLARVSAATGDTPGALLVYQRLCRRDGGTGPACRSAQKLSAGSP
ncbi:MAG: O-antigen ligase family protein [Myxococcota bacterium]